MLPPSVQLRNAPFFDSCPLHAEGPQCIERSFTPPGSHRGSFMSGARLDPDPRRWAASRAGVRRKPPGGELVPALVHCRWGSFSGAGKRLTRIPYASPAACKTTPGECAPRHPTVTRSDTCARSMSEPAERLRHAGLQLLFRPVVVSRDEPQSDLVQLESRREAT